MRLVVRTDASATIGVGHAMRSLAIAEAWIELGGEVVFAMREAPPAVRARIERAGCRVVEPPVDAPYVVVDGYHIDDAEKTAIARSGARVLMIDDRGESATHAATIILNPNAYASPAMYSRLAAKTLLVGREYALLRREFREGSKVGSSSRIMVSFGGADVANLTPRAIEALAPLDVDALVIAGPANPRELSAPREGIRIVSEVDDMAAQMRASGLAIVAAGSTCWELAACGVPMIAVAVAENQRDVLEAVVKLGIGVALRDDPSVADFREAVERLDPETRAEMARRGPQIIDGRGALRVCEVLRGEQR